MRIITTLLAALTLASPAIAGPNVTVRVMPMPMPVRIAPQVYRAPVMSAPRPAPVNVRPSASAPGYRPPVATRPIATVQRATAPAARPMAPRATLRTPTVSQRQAVRPTSARLARPAGTPQRRRYAYRGSNWSWTAPSVMPLWWMAAMDTPYSYDGYDAYIRQCLRTPPRSRSRKCVRALKERGIRG